MSQPFVWDDATVKMLLELKEEGRGVKEIGLILGTTVRSVTGKLSRERGKAIKSGEQFAIPKVIYARNSSAPTVSTEGVGTILKPIKLRLHKGKLVGILNVTGCRWPTEDNPKVIGGKVFCNASKRDGSSYCAKHAQMNRASYSTDLIKKTIKSAIHVLKEKAA